MHVLVAKGRDASSQVVESDCAWTRAVHVQIVYICVRCAIIAENSSPMECRECRFPGGVCSLGLHNQLPNDTMSRCVKVTGHWEYAHRGSKRNYTELRASVDYH